METSKIRVDARQYPPMDKHHVIMQAYKSLKPNETMELINDHDPLPLYYQFQAEMPGKFEWDYKEKAQVIWRVEIKKIEE